MNNRGIAKRKLLSSKGIIQLGKRIYKKIDIPNNMV
jgi:hypothetical protein